MPEGRIVVDPNVMLGKPVIRGTRIPVELLLRKLSEGASIEDLLDAYPKLTGEDVRAAIAYAADTVAVETTVVPAETKDEWVLRFLADECADQRVVAALREDGHDVLAVAEVGTSLEDSDVMALARDEQRILLTEDRDFGRLVYAFHARTAGVIYIRWHPLARGRLGSALLSLVRQLGQDIQRAFVVLTPSGARVRKPPD